MWRKLLSFTVSYPGVFSVWTPWPGVVCADVNYLPRLFPRWVGIRVTSMILLRGKKTFVRAVLDEYTYGLALRKSTLYSSSYLWTWLRSDLDA